MVRKLEPSWHHLSGSGYLVPWTLGVLNGIAAWLKWTEPLSPSGGDAYFVSAKGCDQQGDWGGKIYTKQVSEDPTIHDQVFKSHFSRLRGELDTIIRRCNPPIRSSMNTSTHMDDETQSLCHKPLHCSNLARCLLCSLAFASLPPSSSSSIFIILLIFLISGFRGVPCAHHQCRGGDPHTPPPPWPHRGKHMWALLITATTHGHHPYHHQWPDMEKV